MSDLAVFLNARLDEDEHYLRTMIEASERYASSASPEDTADAYAMTMAIATDPQVRSLLMKAMDGIFRPPNDLHQVLREVRAKRAILALHTGTLQDTRIDPKPFPWCPQCQVSLPCKTLRHFAAVYSDHPDYRQEWKP